LWEFPIAPRSISDHAVLQTLVAPSPVREGFHLILADVLRPPLLPESVDLVVTPWVVDILPENFQAFAARVNRLLKPGGRWVNFGSLAFSQPAAAARYSLEETLAIVMDSGFAAREPPRPSGTGRDHRGNQGTVSAGTRASPCPAGLAGGRHAAGAAAPGLRTADHDHPHLRFHHGAY
jgi:hypothetical protein